MALKGADTLPDDRIGSTGRPKTRSQELIEQILDLQKQIRSLERELKSTQDAESLLSFFKEAPSDYPG